MNEFLKRRLDNLIAKINPKYEELDELYERAHFLEQELNELENKYNASVKGQVLDNYYRGYITDGSSLHEGTDAGND